MKTLAKIVFGTLGCVLVISAVGVMAPRAVYAVVATVIRDQDQPARHPFVTHCLTGGEDRCSAPAIPTGQEFVIETISVFGAGKPEAAVLKIEIITTAGGGESRINLNPVFDSGEAQPSEADYSTAQPLRLYADPGSLVSCFVETKVGFPLNTECVFSGYLVSLP
jgi:hypothetical protein